MGKKTGEPHERLHGDENSKMDAKDDKKHARCYNGLRLIRQNKKGPAYTKPPKSSRCTDESDAENLEKE